MLSTQSALLDGFYSLFTRKWRTNLLSEGAWGNLPWVVCSPWCKQDICPPVSGQFISQEKLVAKQFKLFGLFKVIFLPAPARQGKNYAPLYMTILKEAGSKQTVKWAWGPSWLYHRMLCVASWKSCNLWESTSGLKNETLHLTNHFRFPWAPSALHCLIA